MDTLALALLVVGGFILVVGLFSSLIKSRLFVTAPLLALVAGVLLGPRILGVFDPAEWADPRRVFEIAAGLTLAIALMEVALRLPPRFLVDYWKGMAVLLVVLLPGMWLISGVLVHWAFGVSWIMALLIGAIAAPTDPIVATSIISGKAAGECVPDRLRFLLTAEAGANDGLAYPLFAIPLLGLAAVGPALGPWTVASVLVQTVGAVFLGLGVGLAAAHALHFAEARSYIERTSFLAFALALSLFAFGLARALGVEPLVAVFFSGIAFDYRISSKERHAEERVQETVNQFFTLPIFILLGVAIPWDGWVELGPIAPVTAAGILVLRRLPLVLLLRPLLHGVAERKDAWFLGWFGPIGVAALYFANEAFRQTGEVFPWNLGTLIIVMSLVLHGVSATPLVRRYGPAVPEPAHERGA